MNAILSHLDENGSLQEAERRARARIAARGDQPHATVAEQEACLEGLLTFELGRYLLCFGGLNGFWTEYVCSYPARRARGVPASAPAEVDLLERMPAFVATQDRYAVFKREIRRRLRPGGVFASAPCGLMGDLLLLDDARAADARFVGIDLDPDALLQARAVALTQGLLHRTELRQRDAWSLGASEEFDLISSNGLTMYVEDDARVESLYAALHAVLKPGGTLVTSTVTPPPDVVAGSSWRMDAVAPDGLRRQRILYEVIEGRFRSFRSVETTQRQLEAAGFVRVEVFHERQGIHPTLVAEKNG